MKRHNKAKPNRQGFTPQQMIVLILFALVGSATLLLAGYILVTQNPAPLAPPPVAQVGPGSTNLPPTWTPAPNAEVPPAATSQPAQPIPALPAACAQNGQSFQQGQVMRVLDEKTLEVQAGEAVLRVGYAGISVFSANPNTLTKMDVMPQIREMVEGQPVTLVSDVLEQDAEGRLLRYVFSGSRFVNYELVRSGFASTMTNTPAMACADFLTLAERQAKTEKKGIWQSAPVPTRTFVPFVTLDPNQAACDCSIRYLCSDFRTRRAAQVCLNECNDYSSKLDEDRDGIACEELP